MSEEGYNGWKNYPTWCVNLWLSNDEGLYRGCLELTRTIVNGGHTTPRQGVADTIRNWVNNDLAPGLGASFSADLLGYALDCVDWFEIADAWIEAIQE